MTEQEQIVNTHSGSAYGSTMEALRRAEQSLPDLSTSYDSEIRSLYEKIVNRPAFSYEASSDPLYGMYRDSYVREGSLAMRDTVGRSAALTGGYGSSYAQSVGQQQYGEYLRKLGDVMPELYGAAYKRWQAEGEALNAQLDRASSLAQDEYGRKKDRLSMAADVEQKDYDRRWASYQSLISVIARSGYTPSDRELAETGMSRELADALLKEFKRTRPSGGGGTRVVTGGGGGYGGGSGSKKTESKKTASGSKEAIMLSAGYSSEKGRRK
ncbi:MAG: hypothetical protein K6F56_09450 [Oscillospiraceae bacterium]|nr:hypothetical protein [Oscillospiraceae bacterium]